MLVSVKPAEPLYDRLISYWYYRFVGEHYQLRETSSILAHKYLKELKLIMDSQKLS